MQAKRTDLEALKAWADGVNAIMMLGPPPFADVPIGIDLVDKENPLAGVQFTWEGQGRLTGWRIIGTLVDHDGDLIIEKLTIQRSEGHGDAAGITGRHLRDVPTAYLREVVRDRMKWIGKEDQARKTASLPRRPASQVETAQVIEDSRPGRRGRPELSNEFFLEVARVAAEEFEAGAKGYISRAADRLKTSPVLAREWIWRARNEKHFLLPTKSGRASAILSTDFFEAVRTTAGGKP